MIDDVTLRRLASALFEASRAVGAVVSHAGTIARHHPAMLKLSDAKLAYELAEITSATRKDVTMQTTHLIVIRGRAHAVRVRGTAIRCREPLSCPEPGCESTTFVVSGEKACCTGCNANFKLSSTQAHVSAA